MIFKENGETKPQYWFLSLYWYHQRSNEPESSITLAENTSMSSLSFPLWDFWFLVQMIYNEQVTEFRLYYD